MSVGGVRTAREPPRRQQRVTSSTVRVASPVKATVQTKLHLDGSPPKAPLIVSPPPSVETKRKREAFDYTLDFHSVDFRKNPELYRVGKGEQGVLSVQPYKREILPLWRFKTPEIATKSSADIYALFLRYRDERDFIGMDMSRKFLQMGYTRSRRYANHASGRKYDGPVPQDKKGRSGAHGRDTLPCDEDPIKAESARIFYAAYLKAREDGVYKQMREEWVAKHG